MPLLKHLILTDCKEYVSNAAISKQEIQSNLEKAIASLGDDKADDFLKMAYQILKESVESLQISIRKKDMESCACYAHKLRGSSNLYGSKLLKGILIEFTEQPMDSINNLDKCRILVCEFELVLSILKIKQL